MRFEVEYWEKLLKSEIKNFRFRSKRIYKHVNGGMVNFDAEKNGMVKHIERFAGSSPTYHCFAYSSDGNSYNLRLSCYSCKFKSPKRYGDITVGDPWFIKDFDINNSNLKSTNVIRSLYSTNTRKGEKIMHELQRFLSQEEITFEKSFVQPALVYKNRNIPDKRTVLYRNLDKEDYGSLVERLFKCNLENEHRNFKYNYKINNLKRMIKKVLHNLYG